MLMGLEGVGNRIDITNRLKVTKSHNKVGLWGVGLI